jgi:hypothetical protein
MPVWLHVSEHTEGDGPTIFLHACKMGLARDLGAVPTGRVQRQVQRPFIAPLIAIGTTAAAGRGAYVRSRLARRWH